MTATSPDPDVERLVATLRDLLAADRDAMRQQSAVRREIGGVIGALRRRGYGYRCISRMVGHASGTAPATLHRLHTAHTRGARR